MFTLSIGLRVEAAMASAEINAKLVWPPWGHPVLHQERTITTQRDSTSLKEWKNAWSPNQQLRLSARSIVKP